MNFKREKVDSKNFIANLVFRLLKKQKSRLDKKKYYIHIDFKKRCVFAEAHLKKYCRLKKPGIHFAQPQYLRHPNYNAIRKQFSQVKY